MHPFLAFYLWSAMLPQILMGGSGTASATGSAPAKAAGE